MMEKGEKKQVLKALCQKISTMSDEDLVKFLDNNITQGQAWELRKLADKDKLD